jgi:flagellar hook protein FlgE
MNTQSFKKGRVLFKEMLPQGVQAQTEKVSTPGSTVFEQTNKGYEQIELSNVDLAEEMTSLIPTVNGYKANLKSLQAQQEMTDSLLDLKA